MDINKMGTREKRKSTNFGYCLGCLGD